MYRFQAYRELLLRLGEIDAHIELQELALRALEAMATSSKDPDRYISEQSKKYNIRVNIAAFPQANVQAARGYIVIQYQQMESFLDDLVREGREIFQYTIDGRDNNEEDRLKWVRRVTQERQRGSNQTIDKLHDAKNFALMIDVYNYYTDIRHMIVHPSARKREAPGRHYSRIEPLREQIKSIYNVQPQHFQSIQFDDAILFSRVSKDIAAELSNQFQPTDDEIATIASKEILALNKRPTRKNRIDTAATSYLETKFGLDKERAIRISSEILRAHGLGG